MIRIIDLSSEWWIKGDCFRWYEWKRPGRRHYIAHARPHGPMRKCGKQVEKWITGCSGDVCGDVI